MKQIIPFYKEIVFKSNIANLLSVSLEHEEKVSEGEITGNFIISGEYKIHNDTTEIEYFKYKLPFTTLISEDMNKETIKIDIENFSYEQVESDVLRIDINFSLEYDLIEEECEPEILEDDFSDIDREIDEILGLDKEDSQIDNDIQVPLIIDTDVPLEVEKDNDTEMVTDVLEVEDVLIVNKEDEYVIYDVYVVKENDTIDRIVGLYNTSLEIIKEYNDIKEFKVGDKIIIPRYEE